MTLATDLATQQSELKQWLFDKALPIWWQTGADRNKGGFFEKITLDGTPCDVDRRTRVAARQVYSYALAKSMGYSGETDGPINQGLSWLSGPARNPETGMLYAVLKPDGSVVKSDFDVYDHAFAMLAYATAFSVRRDAGLEAAAVAIRDRIVRDYSHPVRGFEESNPRTLPLKTNPHMHMFEACLAWTEAGGDSEWKRIAAMIADLCLNKFLHPDNGSLREYFDGDWNPMPGELGRVIEPGHQFEWGWLLLRWAKITGEDRYAKAALRLITIAEGYGTDQDRNVTIFELWDDFSVKDAKARLWSQTERMKAYVKLAESAQTLQERETSVTLAVAAAKGLRLYFATDIEGLYLDKMQPDGTFENEPAPASSLYHIICAIDEFGRLSL